MIEKVGSAGKMKTINNRGCGERIKRKKSFEGGKRWSKNQYFLLVFSSEFLEEVDDFVYGLLAETLLLIADTDIN